MASSDSGEDFESADEDFDFDCPPKHKSLSGDESETIEKKSTSKVSPDVLQPVQDLKLPKNESVVNAAINAKNIPVSMDEDIPPKKLDEIISKPPPKRLGTKLSSSFKVNNAPTTNTEKHLQDKSENQKESYDLSSIKTEVEKVDDKETKPTVCHNFKSENEINWPSDEDPLSPRSNFTDGWEIEEEDGFEVPVMLAKLPNDGVQCGQKDVSELDKLERRTTQQEEEQSWGGWGNWGVSSLIFTATESVSTFSNQVTSGLSTVLEATAPPTHEELADSVTKQDEESCELKKVEEEPMKEKDKAPAGYAGFGSLVSGVGYLGSTVLNRGLDTLESLGKKTMEVLQEGDPGLKKKRAMLFQNEDKPVLSQILREAKEKAENCDKEKEEKESARRIHFESLFDDFQGMVHLEALEMLSTQCELKLQSMVLSQSGAQLESLQETLSQIRALCELPDDEDEIESPTPEEFAEKVTKCVDDLRIKISPAKMILVNNEIIGRIDKLSTGIAPIVNQAAISSLAEFTAAAMEFFHKSAELLLAKSLRKTSDEAESYVQLTNHLCARVSNVANEFTQLLTKNHPIANSSLITNIFLEASNCCTYIKNACELLVPILQVGAVSS